MLATYTLSLKTTGLDKLELLNEFFSIVSKSDIELAHCFRPLSSDNLSIHSKFDHKHPSKRKLLNANVFLYFSNSGLDLDLNTPLTQSYILSSIKLHLCQV